MNKEQALILLQANKQLTNDKNEVIKLSKKSKLINIYTSPYIWRTVAYLPDGYYKECK